MTDKNAIKLFKLIRSIAAAIILTVIFSAAARAESAYVLNLDGAHAGTNSAAVGFGAMIGNESETRFAVRVRFSGLSGAPNLSSGVRIVDDNGTLVKPINLQTSVVSFTEEFSLTPPEIAKLKQGKLFVRVATPAFPNGEISGAITAYSAFAGRISGSLINGGGNPNAGGFTAVVLNKQQTNAVLFYSYAGLGADGNLFLFGGHEILSNAPAANWDLVFLTASQINSGIIGDIKRGTAVLTLSRGGIQQARGFAKPLNKDVDFNGDNRADIAVYRPSQGTFYWTNSTNGSSNGFQFGSSQSIPVPADFDGDGQTDYAVWLPSNGVFYVWNIFNNSFRAAQWGQAGDVPLPADYDGDGRADFAVYRPGANNSPSVFYILKSSGGMLSMPFGLGSDIPLRADFDGDRVNDITVFRPSNGTFYSISAADGSFRARQWGMSGDQPSAADFDGDGKADYCIYRPANRVFYVLTSSSNYSSYLSKAYGLTDSSASPADYTGDGKADFAFFKNGLWFYLNSENPSVETFRHYGTAGDIPLRNR